MGERGRGGLTEVHCGVGRDEQRKSLGRSDESPRSAGLPYSHSLTLHSHAAAAAAAAIVNHKKCCHHTSCAAQYRSELPDKIKSCVFCFRGMPL